MPIQQALKLPKVFIFTAFINFIVGATLGGIMASFTSLWPVLSAYHAELNPFGWLTMLIYGMTYIVLFLSLGLKLPRRWQGAVHVTAAEGSIVLILLALLLHSPLLDRVGLFVQALTPLLFMANILSMVISRKRSRQVASFPKHAEQAQLEMEATEQGQNASQSLNQDPRPRLDVASSWSNEKRILSLFGVVSELKATDKVAQRGTDVSLMIFIVAAIWMVVASCMQPITWPFETGRTPQLLVYYGWIAGTVLSVAMHLYPRLFGVRSIAGWYAQTAQVAWGIGVLLFLSASFWTPLETIGGRVVGLGIGLQAAGFLATMRAGKSVFDKQNKFHTLHVLLWMISWFFAFVLGTLLLIGISPLSLAALHLLFLGWITTLVYSIGYRVFPLLLGKTGPPRVIAASQAVMAVVGAILMPVAFIRLMHGGQGAFAQLALGGILAALGALIFLLQWVLSKPQKVAQHSESMT
ncbi:hypothetical protein [Alicyclobacillus sp. SO9]|uniref:hypothetical protein n=1 Tax=Alicyclobacillus sp. SO9 TaxID=2665646 RepID=UPI0018E83F49|nr:hypothetical protein [Alicyclobacillus sp. SO9]QQE77796.1 hypothetical protein GI364_17980 [Alicyclobacillus sp. SO9]